MLGCPPSRLHATSQDPLQLVKAHVVAWLCLRSAPIVWIVESLVEKLVALCNRNQTAHLARVGTIPNRGLDFGQT